MKNDLNVSQINKLSSLHTLGYSAVSKIRTCYHTILLSLNCVLPLASGPRHMLFPLSGIPSHPTGVLLNPQTPSPLTPTN